MSVAPPGLRGGAARRWLELILFPAGIALFGLLSLLWSIAAAGLFRVMPRQAGARLGQRMIMTSFRAFIGAMEAVGLFRCDLSALDALRDEGPLLIAPNHPALLDALLVISRLPRVLCIAKADLWDNWFLGGGIRLAGYIRNDEPLTLVRSALGELRRGQTILVFPEGTRSTAAPIGPFRPGFALMAQRSGVPVQTIILESPSSYLTKGWKLFRQPCFPLVYRARLGARFEVPPEADVREWVVGLEAYFRRELGVAPGAAPQPERAWP